MAESPATERAGTQPNREREAPRVVYRAARGLIEQLLAEPVGSGRAAQGEACRLRVALAVLVLTMAWGKTRDQTLMEQLKVDSHLSFERARRGRMWLEDRGLISYQPGIKGKAFAVISLMDPGHQPAAAPNFGPKVPRIESETAAGVFLRGVLAAPYTAAGLRVALWVTGQLATWLRPDVTFHLQDAAAATGLGSAAVSRAFKAMHEGGLVQYSAASGRGRRSAIALPGYPLPTTARQVSTVMAETPERQWGGGPARKKVDSKSTQRSTETHGKVDPSTGTTLQFPSTEQQQVSTPQKQRVIDLEIQALLRRIANGFERLGLSHDAAAMLTPSPGRSALMTELGKRLQAGESVEDLLGRTLNHHQRPWPAGGALDAPKLLVHRLRESPPATAYRPAEFRLPLGPLGDVVQRIAAALSASPTNGLGRASST